MSELEIRQFGTRSSRPTVGDDNKLSGRAAPFNTFTLIGTSERGFREKINPKAFKKTENDGDQVLLDNHDSRRPLARRSAGTLDTHISSTGWDWRATASQTSYAQDVIANVRAGNYGGCSFSFEVVEDRWTADTEDGIPERELLEVNCREISVVTFPAYDDTTVDARSQVDLAYECRNAFWSRIMEGEARREDRADAKKPYGDVKYADPKNGKYPIDTVEHIHAAWAYINVAKNAAKYPLNGVTVSEVKARIKAAAKSHGIQISGEEQNAATPQHIAELYEFIRSMTAEYDEDTAKRFRQEVSWFQAESEPEETTRALTKEETALFEQRAASMRRAIFESRKASFTK